jgi:hypothetical protein
VRRVVYRKGYFFVSASERLYYISVDHPKYVIVDIENRRVIELESSRVLRVDDISEIVREIELSGEVSDPRVNMVRIYWYEPEKVKVSEKA